MFPNYKPIDLYFWWATKQENLVAFIRVNMEWSWQVGWYLEFSSQLLLPQLLPLCGTVKKRTVKYCVKFTFNFYFVKL